MKDTVLVTGISGYIAGHVAFGLLNKGYKVRGTVRSIAKGEIVKSSLANAGADISALSLVEADLGSEEGWGKAASGCQYIQHLASPFPIDQPPEPRSLSPCCACRGPARIISRFCQWRQTYCYDVVRRCYDWQAK